MAVEFAKGLMVSEVIGAEALERALFVAVSNDSPLEHALLDTNALTPERLETELARGDAPVMQEVVADLELLDRLPAGLCSRLLVVPLRYDERSNTVDVAVVNVFDSHAAEEVAFHLQANVIAVRASLEQIESALRERPSYAELVAPTRKLSNRIRHETPPPDPTYIVRRTPAWGTEVERPREEPPSDIPIPLTRRKSTFAPPLDPVSDDSLATLTYTRLGGGLSLPDAALVRSQSSIPMGPPSGSQAPAQLEDEGLRIDSLPMAAVEIAPSRAGRSSSAPTRREPEVLVSPGTLRRADLPPPPSPAPPPPAAPSSSRRPSAAAPLAESVPLAPRMSLLPPPAITLREGPETARNVPPRPPPISVEVPATRAPSIFPEPIRRTVPPLAVKAPSLRPGASDTRTSVRPPPEATQVLSALKTAPDRDAVLGYVLAGARVVARRIALFVVRRGAYVGWSCTPEFGDATALAALEIPQDAPTVLTWASTEGTYLGPLDPSANGALIAVMGTASRDVAAVPIRVNGKTAVVVVADQLGDTMIATKRLEEIANAAGEALLRIVRAGKK